MTATHARSVYFAVGVSIALLANAEAGHVGDGGLKPIEDRVFEYFPQVDAWAKAGVNGGIPHLDTGTVHAVVQPGQSIQDAIDNGGNGVLALAPGIHDLARPIRMKSGVVLRGAPDGATVLRHSKTDGAVTFDGVQRAGLESVSIVYTGSVAAPPDGIYANTPGFKAGTRAAVRFNGAEDCWVDGCSIAGSYSSPLQIVAGSRHITVREVVVDGVLNRGTDEGCVLLEDAASLLLCSSVFRGIRQIVINAPCSNSVVKGCFFGAAIHFGHGNAIRDMLFDGNVSLLPPLYPWPAFSKHMDPLGPGLVVLNHRAYHQGTDALPGGVILEPGVAYTIQPTALRGTYDTKTLAYEGARMLVRHQTQTRASLDPAVAAAGPESVGAPTNAPGSTTFVIQNRTPVDTWLVAGPFPAAAWDTDDMSPSNRTTWVEGTSVELSGTATALVAIAEDCLMRSKPMSAESRTKMEGKFGRKFEPKSGARVDLLKLVGGEWNRVAILHTLLYVPDPTALKLELSIAGAKAKVWVGGTLLAPDGVVRLAAGFHPLTAKVMTFRRAPFEQNAVAGIGFKLIDASPAPIPFETPPLTHGTLYPFETEPTALEVRERAAADAVFGVFDRFRGPPYPGLRTDLETAAKPHAGTLGGTLIDAWLRVLRAAPADETRADVTPDQWADLSEYYALAGTPERKWAIDKNKNPPDKRVYYERGTGGGEGKP